MNNQKTAAGPNRRRAVSQMFWLAGGVLLFAAVCMWPLLPARAQPAQQERGLKLGGTPTPTPGSGPQGGATEARPELVMQTGHALRVDGLAFSPDGRLIATGSKDGTARLWETATGRELRKLTGLTGWVKAVAFSPDGKWLAAGAVDGELSIWDVLTGEQLGGTKSSASINCLAVSPDARLLAAGSADGMLLLYDVTTGQAARPLMGHTGALGAVVFSPDGKLLASGGRDTTIKLWDVATGRELRTLAGHTDRVRALAFSPDSQRLASGSADRSIKLWDVGKGKEQRTLAGHTGAVLAVAFTADGRRLTSAGADKHNIKVWAVDTGREVQNNVDAEALDTLEAAAFDATGRRVATSNGDKSVGVRDLSNLAAPPLVLATRASGVYANAFSPDGKWFASGSKDNTIRLWETATGRELKSVEAQIGWITSLAFSPDSTQLAAGGLSGAIKLWDVAAGRELRRLDGHTESVNAVSFGPGGQLASASNDKTVKVWDMAAGRVRNTLAGHTGEVHAVAFSPDGKLIASGGTDNTVKLWTAATGQEVRTLAGHIAGVHAVAFSRDGQTLASGSYDQTAKVWDVATGREVRKFDGAAGVTSVVFSADGQQLLAGDLRGNVRVWATPTGQTLRDLAGHTDAINSLAVSPNGRWLTSGSEDGSTRLWASATGTLLATLISLNESADWLVVAPDGLFDGAPEAWGQILWRFERNTYNARPVEAYFNEFYYPGLLADILANRQPKAPQDIALRDRRQPQVTLQLAAAQPPPGDVRAHSVAVKIEVTEAPADAAHPRGSGAQDVRLFRNGSLVKVWRGDVVREGGRTVVETNVPIIAGANQLMAYAFNHDNVKSTNAELLVTGDASLKRQGTAYIVAVGLNQYANPRFNLRYAIADAQTFGEEVQRAQARIDSFAHIEVVPLLNKEATKANMLLALRRLSGAPGELPADAPPALARLQPAQPEDTVIFYYAGHGLAQQQRFYLIPHDLGYQGERSGPIAPAALKTMLEHSVSDRELEAVLDGIDAAQIVMVLDACNSGQALEAEDKRLGPMNSKGLAQLAYEKGMFVLTAAQSYQAAQEAAQLGHGLLTYALVVQGLKEGAADNRPRDGQVVMGEWLDYATQRVPQMQIEKMRGARGLTSEIAFVEGEEKIADPNNRSLQRPRVFYRRELAERPLVVTKLESAQTRE